MFKKLCLMLSWKYFFLQIFYKAKGPKSLLSQIFAEYNAKYYTVIDRNSLRGRGGGVQESSLVYLE